MNGKTTGLLLRFPPSPQSENGNSHLLLVHLPRAVTLQQTLRQLVELAQIGPAESQCTCHCGNMTRFSRTQLEESLAHCPRTPLYHYSHAPETLRQKKALREEGNPFGADIDSIRRKLQLTPASEVHLRRRRHADKEQIVQSTQSKCKPHSCVQTETY